MLHLSDSRAELAELFEVVRGSHHARSRAAILDVKHRVLMESSDWLLDGQVEIDITADVTRSAACTLLDPDGQAGLDWEGPLNGSFAMDKFIQLRRDIWLPHAEKWISCPVFTGPITGVSRSGPVIEVEAQGKEVLAMQPVWNPITFKKGTLRIKVIEDLMRRRAGETFFAIPQGWTGYRTGSDWVLLRDIGDDDRTVWARAQRQADLMNADMFYDARGVLRARHRTSKPVWSVREEDLAEAPVESNTSADIVNTVVVTGGTPSGGRTPVTSVRSLPSTHPWSPTRLGRNGVGRYLPEEIEDSSLVTQSAADRAAEKELRARSTGQVEMQVSMLPIPWLEPFDLITVDVLGVPRHTRLHKATISLSGDLMAYGHLRNYNPAAMPTVMTRVG